MTSLGLLLAWFVDVVLDDVLLATESNIHKHIPRNISPADGAVLGGVGDALDTHHAEGVAALQHEGEGHGAQADGALRPLLVRTILLVLLIGSEVLVIILVVELKVLELDILGAALAEFRPRLTVVDVALELLGDHLQLTVLALHEASRALLLLVREQLEGLHDGLALGALNALVVGLHMLLVVRARDGLTAQRTHGNVPLAVDAVHSEVFSRDFPFAVSAISCVFSHDVCYSMAPQAVCRS